MTPSSQASAAARRVVDAFEGIQLPASDRLVEGDSSEGADIASFFRGRRWQDLNPHEIVERYDNLFFMTPSAVRYYLPAFMITSILHYEAAGGVPDSLLFLLTPPDESTSEQEVTRFRQRFETLTTQQREGILAFLDFLQKGHSEDYIQAKNAAQISGYWATKKW